MYIIKEQSTRIHTVGKYNFWNYNGEFYITQKTRNKACKENISTDIDGLKRRKEFIVAKIHENDLLLITMKEHLSTKYLRQYSLPWSEK